jgi:serine/threonine protein kinase
MGSVFLARDRRLGRLVAVKVLRDNGQSPTRLLAEARATARASQENIVVIYDVGLCNERPHLILEYLNGQTLRHALSKARGGVGRPMPRGVAIDIMTAVVRALVAAHESGIVHRDLKPENIMLLDSGQVKVLDFGLAQSVKAANRGSAAGTFAYMSPEQWRGQEVDERSDIWAVGIVLFELFTGAHPLAPFAQNGLSSIVELDTPMPSLRDVCGDVGGLSEVVDRCLRKRKEERFVSAAESRSS